MVSNFTMQIVDSIINIQVERENNNFLTEDQVLPVFLHKLIKFKRLYFTCIVIKYHSCLKLNEMMNKLELEHHKLLLLY